MTQQLAAETEENRVNATRQCPVFVVPSSRTLTTACPSAQLADCLFKAWNLGRRRFRSHVRK